MVTLIQNQDQIEYNLLCQTFFALHLLLRKQTHRLISMATGISFYNEAIDGWKFTYYVLGIILILFAIIYVIFTFSELKNEYGQEHGKFSAQISYIICVFVKGLGLLVCGVFLSYNFNTRYVSAPSGQPNSNVTLWGMYSVLPGGIPGYMTSIAYCFIFFSWCSVCLTFLDRNSVGFYKTSKTILLSLLTGIIIGFITSFIFMLLAANSHIGGTTVDGAHMAEAMIATVRDIVIAIAFIIYLFKISKLFETACPSYASVEGRLFWLCVMLIIALIFRPFCILTYHMIFASKRNTEIQKKSEFSNAYLIIFLIEQTITELLPLGLIGYLRLCDISKGSSASDDKNSAFLAFD